MKTRAHIGEAAEGISYRKTGRYTYEVLHHGQPIGCIALHYCGKGWLTLNSSETLYPTRRAAAAALLIDHQKGGSNG